MTTHRPAASLKPHITLSAGDYERLSILAHAAMNRAPELATALVEELDRAKVLARGRHPDQIVCMGSEVTFCDDATGKSHTVTLVYPGEADISQGKISVLTPVGTALIGLRAGHSITWEAPTRETRQLTVLEVREHHAP